MNYFRRNGRCECGDSVLFNKPFTWSFWYLHKHVPHCRPVVCVNMPKLLYGFSFTNSNKCFALRWQHQMLLQLTLFCTSCFFLIWWTVFDVKYDFHFNKFIYYACASVCVTDLNRRLVTAIHLLLSLKRPFIILWIFYDDDDYYYSIIFFHLRPLIFSVNELCLFLNSCYSNIFSKVHWNVYKWFQFIQSLCLGLNKTFTWEEQQRR